MSDEEALLAAIIANPDEDTPRLVYADWLQENGQAERAEFIRLQIQNAGKAIAERSREIDLLRLHKRRWDRPFQSLFPGSVLNYRRGFVAAVRTEWVCYQRSLAPLLRLTPVEQIIVGKSYSEVLTGNYIPYASQPVHVRFCLSIYSPDRLSSSGDLDVLRLEPAAMEPYLRNGRWVIGCSPYRSGQWNLTPFRISDYHNAIIAGSQCRLAFRPFRHPSEFDSWCPVELPGGYGYWPACWLALQDGVLVDFRLAHEEGTPRWFVDQFSE